MYKAILGLCLVLTTTLSLIAGPNHGLILGPSKKLTTATSSAPSSLLTGLYAFWKMEEDGANDRTDSSGNNLSLTANNTPAAVSGKINNACEGSATGDACLNSSAVTFINTDWTVAFWIKFTGVHEGALCGRYSGSGHGWFIHELATTHVLYFFAGNSNENGGNGISAGAGGVDVDDIVNTWVFIVVTFKDSDFTTHFEVRDSSGNTLGSGDGTSQEDISVEAFDFFVDGIVIPGNNTIDADFDAFGIWNRILTSDEINTLYNSGNGREHPFN